MYNLSKLFVALSILVVSACSDVTPSNAHQANFCQVVSKYKDAYIAENKKDNYIDQKSALENIFDQRTESLKSILKDGNIENWEGTINRIGVHEGKGAYLEVELSCGVYLEPQDSLIISVDSPLYQQLRRYSENSKVIFSGHFIIPPNEASQNKYPHESYYGEKSITTMGSIREPEFLFMFTAFHD